ncbi:MAG: SMP-30/gluconolactonase/LRE family protein [Pedobacter sp.]|nr:MAG: SMP-30/gluconolactonase/LRE family protein [Pedobacter sp.]
MMTAQSNAQEIKPTIGKIEVFDKKMQTIVDEKEAIEILATGIQWAEGPVWVHDGSYLLFSDPKQNTIFRWSEGEGLSEFLKPSGYTGKGNYSDEPGSNGLIINNNGELVSCEHGDRRISLMPLTGGGKLSIADKWNKKRFNSPNDICQHSNGTYYFTDPPYGLPEREKDKKNREIEQNGVYSVDQNGKVEQVISDLARPNGVAFSPDEKMLYVAQSDEQAPHIIAYPVKDGKVSGDGKVFFDFKKQFPDANGVPDGIKADEHGNIFAGAGDGVAVISKEGKLLGRIYTGVTTANCAFGEKGYLYITASEYVLRVKLKTRALAKTKI